MSTAQLDALLAAFAATRSAPDADLATRRADWEAASARFRPDDVTFETLSLGGVPVEEARVRGAAAAAPGSRTFVYAHGGAYVSGSPRTHRRLTAAVARAFAAGGDGRVLSLDYRLAPEHPFPAALDDALAALSVLEAGGTHASEIVLAGDSAGGGLVAATLIARRDRALPQPAGAWLISPWLDLAHQRPTHVTRAAEDPILTREALDLAAAAYRAGRPVDDPLVSPLGADWTGIAPLLIHVGGREILLDDALALAARVAHFGGDVTLSVKADMVHCFPCFSGLVDEADQALAEALVWIDRLPGAPR